MNKLNTIKNKSIAALRAALSIDIFKLMPQWWRGESKAAKTAFYAALIIGFISHLFIYTNRYFGDHDVGMIAKHGPSHGSGRWLSIIMTNVNYGYILPLVSGIYVTFFLAVSAFLICKLIDINKTANAVLLAALLTTFPSISNINVFLLDSANYHFATMLAVIAVYVTMKLRFGFLVGGILSMCVLAIYQPMFNVTITLCLLVLISQTLRNDTNWKAFRGSVLRFFLMGGLSGALYVLSLFMNTHLNNRSLSGYRGMDLGRIGSMFFSLPGLVTAIKRCYQSYVNGLFDLTTTYMLVDPLKYAYIFAMLLAAIFLIIIVIQQKIYKQPSRLFMLGLLVLLIPFSSNFSNFIDLSGSVNMRSIYAFVLIFAFFLALVERVNIYPLIKSTLLCLLIFIALNWIIVNNVYYLQAWFFNQTSNSISTRVFSRVEEQLAYSKSGQITYFGGIPNEFLKTVSNEFTENPRWRSSPLNSEGYGFYFLGMNWERQLINNLSNLHGINVSFLRDDDTKQAIRQEILDTNMPPWPLEGSVAVIFDVIVINYGIADVIHENNSEEGHAFHARHYQAPELVAHDYEYHWRLFRNGVLVHDGLTDSDRFYIEPLKAYGAYAAWVTVKNVSTGYEYKVAQAEATLGIPGGGTAADILPAYLAQIKDDNHIIIISAKDEASTAFTEGMAAAFRDLGLSESPQDKYRHSYIAIIDGDDVVFEDISPDLIEHAQGVGDVLIEVESAGFDAGDTSAILIDAVEYSPNMRGLNIVVYDKAAGAVVDAVNFDTYEDP